MTAPSTRIQFGWVLPPGYNAQKDFFLPNRHAEWQSWMAPGPQGRDGRERWDAGIRRVLNTITGQWDSAWMTDHFQWDEADCLEALTTLAFYAALTPHLRWGAPDQVAAKIEALIEAGCTYFMFDSRGLPEPGELEALIEVTGQFA